MYLPFYFFSSLTKLYYIWIFSLKNPDSYLHSPLYLFFLRLFLNMSKQNYLSISRPHQACMQWHTHLLTSPGEILSIPLGFFLPGRSQVILLYIYVCNTITETLRMGLQHLYLNLFLNYKQESTFLLLNDLTGNQHFDPYIHSETDL